MHHRLSAALGIVAIALAGCSSSSGGSTSPVATTQSAASSAAVSSSATPEAKATVGQSVDFSAVAAKSAAAAKAAGAVHATVSLAGKVLSDGDVNYATGDQSQTLSLAGQTVKILFVDRTVYLGGTLAQGLKSPTPWVKVDTSGTDAVSKKLAPLVAQLKTASNNPAAALATLSDVKGVVTAADATSTTYKVTFTKEQVAQLAKANAGLLGASGQSLPAGSLSYDYTVSNTFLPQKVVLSVSGQTIMFGFSQWGAKLAIAAPPASEVTESSHLTTAA